jgi:hypothetical protein
VLLELTGRQRDGGRAKKNAAKQEPPKPEKAP